MSFFKKLTKGKVKPGSDNASEHSDTTQLVQNQSAAKSGASQGIYSSSIPCPMMFEGARLSSVDTESTTSTKSKSDKKQKAKDLKPPPFTATIFVPTANRL
ncbi:uncharacterized protein SPPG_02533 [Spizellomyces punctatus DAOM BR117]|uniref:Uncharacterized protein n=1 Tax=Spizellomyces punctatus (strain DAOM BR117) TaxID=645134 RepID=A0A0L0HM89_SPIPD|nr:uncharacterized protein SPPG_02533 [Spizellomyces punctatus DAOM BR117]KND02030.1 hypothetical protein SPPG_02533 [Spizellomyces punctatus DAOM BR117]|eukprot:XP_016610069.1 hypothetical protein SPPG_02533 [Spizellomyces punctatus DAOM BR117]